MIKAATIGSGNIDTVLMIEMPNCPQHMVLAAPAMTSTCARSSLGRRRIVGGPEDMILDVALDMLPARGT